MNKKLVFLMCVLMIGLVSAGDFVIRNESDSSDYYFVVNGTTGNTNITGTSFFSYLGSLASRIVGIFATDVDVSNNLTVGGNLSVDTNVLFVDSDNDRVGIGTTSPATALHIDGSQEIRIEADGAVFSLYNDAGARQGYLQHSTNMYLINEQNSDLYIRTNNLDRITVKNDGNVGIGTTSPAVKLQVSHGGFMVNNSGNASLFYVDNVSGNVGIGTGSPDVNLHVLNPSTNSKFKVESSTDDSNIILDAPADEFNRLQFVAGGTDKWQIIRPANSDDLQVYDMTNDVVAMTFQTSTDNVGIGTTSPNGLLNVNGTGILFNVTNTTGGDIMVVDGTSGNVGIGTASPSSLFEVSNSANTNEVNLSGVVYVNSTSGNVGIGTTSPQTRLHVMDGGLNVSNPGNASLFVVDNVTGRVGIGTGSPQNTLHVLKSGTAGTPAANANDALIVQKSGTGESGVISIITSTAGVGGFLVGDTDARQMGVVFYDNNGDYMRFDTNANERMRIDSSGNIGIGTTSPNALLEVDSAGVGANGLSLNVSGDLFVNASSGNVGIGTGSPGVKLDVNGKIRTAQYYESADTTTYFQGNSGTIDDVTTNYKFGDDTAYLNIQVDRDGTEHTKISAAPDLIVVADSGDFLVQTTSGRLQLYSSGGLAFGSTFINTDPGLDNMIIQGNLGIGTTSPNSLLEVGKSADTNEVNLSGVVYVNSTSGNVGIGTGSPGAKLDILGASGSTMRIVSAAGTVPAYMDGQAYKGIYIATPSGSGDYPGIETVDTVGTHMVFGGNTIGTLTNHDLRILTNSNDAIRVTNNGNVGIGTTSPNSTLDVAGTLNVSGAVVLARTSGNVGIGTTSPGQKLHVYNGGLLVNNSGNASLFLVDNVTGNVGIGTTGPGAKLDISTVAYLQDFRISMDGTCSGGRCVGLGIENLGTYYGMAFYYNNAKAMVLDSTGGLLIGGTYATTAVDAPANGLAVQGNVGIGTTSPSGKLNINGTGTLLNVTNTTGGDVFVVDGTTGRVGIGTGSPGSKLAVVGGDIYVDEGQKIYLDGGSNTYIYSPSNDAVEIGAGTTDDSNAIIKFSQLDAGLPDTLVIGATTTKVNLGLMTSTFGGSANGEIALGSGTIGAAAANMVQIATQDYAAGDARLYIQSESGDQIILGKNRIETSANDLSLQPSSGNVGIGTTSPNATLHVIGNTTNSAFFMNGNVGIGTTAPGYKLDVNGSAGFRGSTNVIGDNNGVVTLGNGQFIIRGATDTAKQIWFTMDTTNNLGTINVGRTGTGAYNLALQNYGGNVGIGTTSPQTKLHVNGNILSNGTINSTSGASFGGNVGIGTTSPNGLLNVNGTGILLNVTNTTGGDIMVVDGTSGNVGIGTTAPGALLQLGDNTNNINGHLRFEASDGDEIDINITTSDELGITGGNVGIGTTNPSQKLDVSGNIIATTLMGGSLQLSNSGTASAPALFKNTDTNTGIYFPDADKIGLVAGGSGLTVSSGNVGIGTTSPTWKLQVNGSVNLNNTLYVNQTSGNVGIGTASPGTQLQIHGSTPILRLSQSGGINNAESGRIQFGESGTQAHMEIHYDGDNNEISFDSPEDGNYGFLVIERGGNVGIGTTSPSFKLDVSNSTQGVSMHPTGGISDGPLINTTGSVDTNLTITSVGGSVIIKLG